MPVARRGGICRSKLEHLGDTRLQGGPLRNPRQWPHAAANPTNIPTRPTEAVPPLLGPESLNGKYVLEIRPLPIPRGVLGPFLTKYPKACGVFAIAKFRATMPRMALSPKKKATIIKSSARHDKDTGSPEVQVNLISKRIDDLSKHLKKNRKDKHSRRGLLGLVAERRTHLEYLKKKNPVKHAELLKKIKE